MGREVLKSAKLDGRRRAVHPLANRGRLPGLIAGQIDGVALHPEDVFLAKKQKPTLNMLVQLVELMPLYMFNAYGASTEWIARDRPLLRDTVAAMIEANRAIYREKDKVVPIIVEATKKPKEAVEYAWDITDQELRVVGEHGLRPRAHAMVDRQQRRERRHRGGQEAECRAGGGNVAATEAVESGRRAVRRSAIARSKCGRSFTRVI